LKCCCNLSFA